MLGVLFAGVALFYASVGFGGGSSYLALLVLFDVNYLIIPALALICNITVVSGNSFHYIRAGHLNWPLLWPPILTSVPFAYLGGSIPIEKELFLIILFTVLLLAGLRLLFQFRQYTADDTEYNLPATGLSLLMGAMLGFVSGLVGIGGGIFLAPLLLNLKAAPPKQIATTASLFILVNSLTGLLGQLQKSGVSEAMLDYWYLPLLVLLGGQVGNLLTIKFIPSRMIALLTACLVLFVAVRLGLHIWL